MLTAMMSARGTITSATRTSCRPRTFLRIARSCGVKSALAPASSSASSMSSRTEAGPRPNRPRSRSNKPGMRFASADRARPARRRRARSFWRFAHALGSAECVGAVGVGDAEPRQNARLHRLHRFGVGVVLVVEADQMQEAVDDEMAIMVGERLALLLRLALHRLEGEDDVAEQARLRQAAALRGGKGQDVGRLVEAAPARVELAHMRVVGEMDAKLRAVGRAQRRTRATLASIASRANFRAGSAARQRGEVATNSTLSFIGRRPAASAGFAPS